MVFCVTAVIGGCFSKNYEACSLWIYVPQKGVADFFVLRVHTQRYENAETFKYLCFLVTETATPPIVTSGVESWTLTNKMEEALMTWGRKILRKIYGIPH
jgi:hypothetical protein